MTQWSGKLLERMVKIMIIDDLGIEYPVFQGPMGGGASSVELVGTVSDEGGLGGFGAVGMSPDGITNLVEELKSRTQRPFGVNLWVSTFDDGPCDRMGNASPLQAFFEELGVDYPELSFDKGFRFEDQVEALLKAQPSVFSFVYGIPEPEVIQECQIRGIKTVGTATTVEEAVELERAGVDAIVASGQEAGGHRGSFLRPAEESLIGTMILVPQVVDAVSVPVIAAGGIADARGVKAALALGAEAVQVGTAFLACQESGAHPRHRDLLLEGSMRTVLTKALSGRLARGLANRLAMTKQEPLPYPYQRGLVAALKSAALEADRIDLVPMWAGQTTGMLKFRKARDLMKNLVSGL